MESGKRPGFFESLLVPPEYQPNDAWDYLTQAPFDAAQAASKGGNQPMSDPAVRGAADAYAASRMYHGLAAAAASALMLVLVAGAMYSLGWLKSPDGSLTLARLVVGGMAAWTLGAALWAAVGRPVIARAEFAELVGRSVATASSRQDWIQNMRLAQAQARGNTSVVMGLGR